MRLREHVLREAGSWFILKDCSSTFSTVNRAAALAGVATCGPALTPLCLPNHTAKFQQLFVSSGAISGKNTIPSPAPEGCSKGNLWARRRRSTHRCGSLSDTPVGYIPSVGSSCACECEDPQDRPRSRQIFFFRSDLDRIVTVNQVRQDPGVTSERGARRCDGFERKCRRSKRGKREA